MKKELIEQGWLTPRMVVDQKLVPFSYLTLMRRIKANKIRFYEDEGMFYFRPEWIEEYNRERIKKVK
ncbi:MAG: hypothetical protein M0R80_18500 [Proteobacteria bacterium]|jgi:hypothetical protein|nr:hypothetical protein [Pseudomonadota bacterium]